MQVDNDTSKSAKKGKQKAVEPVDDDEDGGEEDPSEEEEEEQAEQNDEEDRRGKQDTDGDQLDDDIPELSSEDEDEAEYAKLPDTDINKIIHGVTMDAAAIKDVELTESTVDACHRGFIGFTWINLLREHNLWEIEHRRRFQVGVRICSLRHLCGLNNDGRFSRLRGCRRRDDDDDEKKARSSLFLYITVRGLTPQL